MTRSVRGERGERGECNNTNLKVDGAANFPSLPLSFSPPPSLSHTLTHPAVGDGASALNTGSRPASGRGGGGVARSNSASAGEAPPGPKSASPGDSTVGVAASGGRGPPTSSAGDGIDSGESGCASGVRGLGAPRARSSPSP